MSEEKEYERVQAPSLIPYFAVGAFCFIYALIFPLYLLWHFIIFALLSVAVFLIFKKFCKPRYITVQVEKAPKTDEEIWQDTALDYLVKLKNADIAIEDEEISESIRKIEKLSAKIFEAVSSSREKRFQVRRFMEYYLPTLLKLLSVYDNLEERGTDGQNVRAMKDKISGLLITANKAFTKLADDLYEQDNIDVSSDITVFNNLLHMEGLVDENE